MLFMQVSLFAQKAVSPLSVDKIMQDPQWIGSSPSGIQWDRAGGTFYFRWNPDKSSADSLYRYTIFGTSGITKVPVSEQYQIQQHRNLIFTRDRSMWTFEKNGNIYFQTDQNSYPIQVTNTIEKESNPYFSFYESALIYTKNDNLYAWNIADGSTIQLCQFIKEAPPKTSSGGSLQDNWLKADQLKELTVLAERKRKKDLSDSLNKKNNASFLAKPLRPIYIENKILDQVSITPDGRYISYTLSQPTNDKNTIVPNYVTESGFTTTIPGRTKVGAHDGIQEMMIYDRIDDTVIKLSINMLEGIRGIPEYFKDYPEQYNKMKKDSAFKSVNFSDPVYAPSSGYAIVDVRSNDYKDRWICMVDFTRHKLEMIDHQHDEAWIAGPGIGWGISGLNIGWIDNDRVWFQSEVSGYSHLYVHSIQSGKTTALTQGQYEVIHSELSPDKKTFYITTNAVHPGEQHFYHLPVTGGNPVQITAIPGAEQVTVSPDAKYIAYLHSDSNHPWELFIQENIPGSKPVQLTDKATSPEFKAYPWRQAEVITFEARDKAKVYARIYKPEKKSSNHAAVIFVHGAGYLQNAHKWWSNYYREYMFNNLLTDLGYTVMDIDYRASAGYGRDWRTGIYRHMGGKDLSDHIDAATYLSSNHGVDPKRIGIYGGSYGGFITLMGLFTAPDVFAAGAALRPVTDWAQYNHGYTANILNEPFTDSIAYHRSSPWYYANGLKNPLLICHGMVDVNVHYQDAVKLAQRLIELKKENWELASYPMEDHGFVEPSSWTDEFKRILKLFNTHLLTSTKGPKK
jgi:dipeptidyl aminopeptidase/acylaminoacyl peptidase